MIQTVLTRGAWLMLGAAIGVAAAILGGSLGATAEPGVIPVTALAGVLIVTLGVALLPGVGEIESTAAHTMLAIPTDRVSLPDGVPRPWWRTATWTTVHAITGLVAGFSVIGVLPGGVLTIIWSLTGRSESLDRIGFDWPTPLSFVAGAIMIIQAPLVVIALGWIAARLAPSLLGPSAADRLAVVQARLAAERRHTVLARELHDGIGHALSIISIQSAAARRVIEQRPDRTVAALHVIEQTSREAQAELDHLLGLLRDPSGALDGYRATLDDLPGLLARHREAGMTITETDRAGELPRLISGAAADIVAEALANAQRHAPGQPVTLGLDLEADNLVITVTNPVAEGRARNRLAHHRTGHGILGLRERVGLMDGTLTAGPEADQWQIRATLPLGQAR